MKKIILGMALLTSSIVAFAQSTSKNYRPNAGDFSIGFDAVPIMDYVFDKTRVFSNTPVSSASSIFNFQQPFTLSGKYMIDENKAYRATLRLGYDRNTQNAFVSKIGGAIGEEVTDSKTTSNFGLKTSFGKQFYRGEKNLRGFYGYEGILGIYGENLVSQSYGNELSDKNTRKRLTSSTGSWSMELGARLFVGLEYFFAPKLSLSAEIGYGMSYKGKSGASANYEEFVNGQVEQSETQLAGTSEFMMNADNSNGSITFSFYF